MTPAQVPAEESLAGIAEESAPVLETIFKMNLDTLEACSLDARTYFLVRLAALVAMNAPPASFLVNLSAAGDAGVTIEEAQGVLVAIAPITGTARLTAAAGNVLRGLGLAAALEES